MFSSCPLYSLSGEENKLVGKKKEKNERDYDFRVTINESKLLKFVFDETKKVVTREEGFFFFFFLIFNKTHFMQSLCEI